LELRWGKFTCARRQVTLCDPIWQVILHSSEMGFPQRAIHTFHEAHNSRDRSAELDNGGAYVAMVTGKQ